MKKRFFLAFVIFQIVFVLTLVSKASAFENCGEVVDSASACNCAANNNQTDTLVQGSSYCCGTYGNGECRVFESETEYGCGETNDSPTVTDGLTCNCEGGQWESYEQWDIIWTDRGICCGWVQVGDAMDSCLTADPSETTAFCGETYPSGDDAKECICGGSNRAGIPMDSGEICCGWLRDGSCQNTDVGIGNTTVDGETLSNLNPISIGGGDADLSTPGGIISKALGGFVFPIAGIILFVVLLLGGFQMLTGATNSKSLDEGKQRITAAITGFILLFAAYWIAQLLELIFGIRILS